MSSLKNIHQIDTTLYTTEKISCCLYASFVNSAKQIKSNCNYEVKPQLHNVAYNLKKNPWAISALSTGNLQVRCLQKTYRIDIKIPFQLKCLPNACKVYCRNISMPVTVKLKNNNPTLSLHRCFPGI